MWLLSSRQYRREISRSFCVCPTIIGESVYVVIQDWWHHLRAVQLRRLLVFELLCYTQTIAFTELVALSIHYKYINYMYKGTAGISQKGPYLRGFTGLTPSPPKIMREVFFLDKSFSQAFHRNPKPTMMKSVSYSVESLCEQFANCTVPYVIT